LANGLTPELCREICGSSVTGMPCQIQSESEGFVTILCPPTCVAGRRPPGWQERKQVALGLGAYWARQAELESASVLAFRGLRGELRAHRAPRALLRALSRAARDERRHARATGALSRRFGGRPFELAPARASARSLEAIALDNVSEGCVRELYGALVATYQARAARDPEVRAAMARIAREETQHAALSLRIQRWLERRLDPQALARVKVAKRRAACELRREITTQAELPCEELSGHPNRAEGARLFDSIADVLFV
jgi:rubrerythrin